jgi:hypothetical protein
MKITPDLYMIDPIGGMDMKKIFIHMVLVIVLLSTGCELFLQSFTVSINSTQTDCKVGDEVQLDASISGDKGKVESVSWSSPGGGTFSSGTDVLHAVWVAPNTPGTYTIKFMATSNGFLGGTQVDTMDITVTEYHSVTDITLIDNPDSITLSWKNPDEESYQSTIVMRSTLGPEFDDSWETIYEGEGTTTTDFDVESGKNYYYKLYAQYSNSKRSSGQIKVILFPYQNYLSSISASQSVDFSDFAYNSYRYEKIVPYEVDEIAFKAIGRVDDLHIQFTDTSGTATVGSGDWTTASHLSLGSNSFQFEVSPVGKPGMVTTYTIVLEREEDMISLDAVSVRTDASVEQFLDVSGEIMPCQIKNATQMYQIKASYTGDAKLFIDGVPVDNTTWSPEVPIGEDSKSVLVELKDCEDTIIVRKTLFFERVPVLAQLSSLSFDSGSGMTLGDFSPTIYDYSVQVPKAIGNFQLIPVVDEPEKLVIKIAGLEVASGTASSSIPIAPGTTKTVLLYVAAKDDAEVNNTYSIVFTRPALSENADLAELTVSGVGEYGFNPNTTGYELSPFSYMTDTVVFNVTTADTNATVAFRKDGGSPTSPTLGGGNHTLGVDPGGNYQMKIVVTAEAGNVKEYTLSVSVQPKPVISVDSPTSSTVYELDSLSSIDVHWSTVNANVLAHDAGVRILLRNASYSKYVGQTQLSQGRYSIDITPEVRDFIKSHYTSNPDDFRVEVELIEDTSIDDKSDEFTIQPKFYTIECDINNYSGYQDFSNLTAEIYNKDGSYYSLQETWRDFDVDMDGTFKLPAGSYRIAVYHDASPYGKEYWGYKDFTVGSGSGTIHLTFTRSLPIVYSVNAIDREIDDDDDIVVEINSTYDTSQVISTEATVYILVNGTQVYESTRRFSYGRAEFPSVDTQYTGTPSGDVDIRVKLITNAKMPTGQGSTNYLTDIIKTYDISDNITLHESCTVTVNNFNNANSNIDWDSVRLELWRSSNGVNYSKADGFSVNRYTRKATIDKLDYNDYHYRVHVFYNTSAMLTSSDYDDEYWGFWELDNDRSKTLTRFMPCAEYINYALVPTDISDNLEYYLFYDSLDFHRGRTDLYIQTKVSIYDVKSSTGTEYYNESKQFRGTTRTTIEMLPYKEWWESRPLRPSSMFLFGNIYAQVPDLDGVGAVWLKTDSWDWTDVSSKLEGFMGE